MTHRATHALRLFLMTTHANIEELFRRDSVPTKMPERVRAFISIDIEDQGLLTRISHIQSQIDWRAAKIKLVEIQNIHITLRFLGDTSLSRIEEIRSRLCDIALSPFAVRIEGVGAFPSVRRPNVIWVGVAENRDRINQIKSAIDQRLAELGYSLDRRFHPHATIARVRAVHDRERVVSNLESLRNESVGTMVVTCFRMKKSTLTPSGPIYDTLWSIPEQ